MHTASSIIEALGGPSEVAIFLDVTQPAVSNMARRGKISEKYWATICDSPKAKSKGITLRALFDHAAKNPPSASNNKRKPKRGNANRTGDFA